MLDTEQEGRRDVLVSQNLEKEEEERRSRRSRRRRKERGQQVWRVLGSKQASAQRSTGG